MTRPACSVIIPVYNVERFLAKCLDSVFAQTLDSCEVICVNDGSTDSSPEILARYAADHASMRVIHKENGGLSSARNAGLDVARGEYVWFVDSDDRVLGADALARLVRRATEASADVLIFGAELEFEAPASESAQAKLRETFRLSGTYPDGLNGQELYARLVDGKDYLPSVWSHLYRLDFLKEHNLRFEDGLLFEDQLFTLQCLSLARRTAQIDGLFYLYCVREGSIMTDTKLQLQAGSYYRNAAGLTEFYRAQLRGAPRAFRARYFTRVRYLAAQGSDCLLALPPAERSTALASLRPQARRIANASLFRVRFRPLGRRLRALKRKLRP